MSWLKDALYNNVVTAAGREVFFDPLAAAGEQVAPLRALRWHPAEASTRWSTPMSRKARGRGRYLDVTMALDLSWEETRRYYYCTVEFAHGDHPSLPLRDTVLLQLDTLRQVHTVRVMVPDAVRASTHVRVTLAPAPHAQRAAFKVVRLHLTARCNLTCSHCATHATHADHRLHNRMQELSLDHLEALAEQAFPSLTAINLSGRGEPLMADERLWQRFVELVIRHRVMLAITTNGWFLMRRITPELMPFISNVNVSMDGFEPETFAANRGGTDIARIWRNVAHFHRLRQAAQLPRRPRLQFAWTLRKNNMAELPDFVRKIAEYDADTLTVRHLMVFFPSLAGDSALEDPVQANLHLRQAYQLLEQHGIERDCVPLMKEPPREPLVQLRTPAAAVPAAAPTAAPAPGPGPSAEPDRCMFIHRMPPVMCNGEVKTCSVPTMHTAGDLSAQRFEDIWNGPVFRDVRAAMGTADEKQPCRTCWYREGRFASQRDLRQRGERYADDAETQVSQTGLDFTRGRD